MDILHYISRSKPNQAMKPGQIINFTREIIFIKNYAENEIGILVPKLFLFFKKTYIKWKQVVCSVVSVYFDSPQLELNKILGYWSRDILNWSFSEKGLGLVPPPYFLYDFSRKMFFMLYSINWPNFIVWLPLLLEILGNKYIKIVC